MKTIKSLTILTVLLITQSANSQILWSYHYGSNNVDDIKAISTDNANNVYTSGSFQGNTLIFNAVSIPVDGYDDIYLAKFDATGNSIWAKRFGGYNNSLNSEGTTGHYYDCYTNSLLMSIDFYPSIILGNDTLLASNGDALVKLDTGGNVIWAKQFPKFFRAITTDSMGNIYVWGTLETAATIDSIPLQPGVFIAKLNSTGNVLWAKKMFNVYGFGNGLLKVTPKGMKIFNNEIYLTADTKGDTIRVDTTNYPQPYTNSAALMKFTNDGNLIWMKTFGPSIDGAVTSLAMDGLGNCYVPGGLTGTIHFDADSISSQSATTYDGFLAKYDSSGHLQWLQQLHANGNGAVLGDITSDNDGNCYVSSLLLGGTAMFGNFTYNSSASPSYNDNCVARYNSSGTCLGVQQIGISYIGTFVFIAQDNSNNVVAVGDYQNSITLGGATYSSYGNNDIAIAKLAVITGIHGNERHANNQLIIYANPTAGKCNITVPDDFLHEKNLILSIYTNDGKLIQQKNMQTSPLGGQGAIKLNLEAEAKGIYIVTLSNGVKVYSGKILLE